MLIRNAEIDGERVDVAIRRGVIAEIGADLVRETREPVLDAKGGALLPGLHDHHIHLQALAAAETSVRCGPPEVRDETALAETLQGAAARGDGWLRGVAYHESVAGPLDRRRLDGWVRDRPLRIQHRSGAAWLLNSAGLAALDLEDSDAGPAGIERDASGRATGRLFRADDWLRSKIPPRPPDLGAVGGALARMGVTGCTDASADNDASSLERLCDATRTGALPQRLRVMGTPELPTPHASAPRVTRGAVKILLDEPRLPEFATLCTRIDAAHRQGRNVAIHCVTRVEVAFAVAALEEARPRSGDRLEHAAVAPPEWLARIAELGLTVVTQPHFVAERGDAYRSDVDPADLPWLYRARGWRDAGVPLAGGSDAPYGAPDPWRSMAAAVERRTESGAPMTAEEALTPEEALSLYTTSAEAPGGATRRVVAGAPADLCLLDRPWRDARHRLRAEDVVATWCTGSLVASRDEARPTA